MLTNNYYIGIFPVTQGQWALSGCQNAKPSYFTNNPEGRAMRPVENVCYNEIRMAEHNTAAHSDAMEWPGAPYSNSVLDLFRQKTGIDFDLPSEAQWEFAARAGNGDTKWGDGSYISDIGSADENFAKLGRCKVNGGMLNGESPGAGSGPEHGTAIVGSYKANDWGLYDMHGNVWEWCLDWYKDNISDLNGAVNVVAAEKRVIRGGSWNYDVKDCRPASRISVVPSLTWQGYGIIGFRLACRAGLD